MGLISPVALKIIHLHRPQKIQTGNQHICVFCLFFLQSPYTLCDVKIIKFTPI